MAQPWADPNVFGAWFGAIGGGVGGSLAGILGGLAGWLAPRGRGRPWILGGLYAFLAFGVTSLAVGLFALATGQPDGIWYPFLLCGAVFTLVLGINLPIIRRTYAAAEARRLDAESLRAR